MGRLTENPMSKSIRIKKPKVNWADVLLQQIHDFGGLPIPVREHRFHKTRRWRFDLAFLKEKLAVEIEGGVWVMGRHIRPAGFLKDIDKYKEAVYYGGYLVRFTPNDVKMGKALQYLNKYFIGDVSE